MDFAKTSGKMFEFASGQPILLYKPVIERDFGQERFLTEDPTCLMHQGKFQKVDILTGLTQYEFINPAVCEFGRIRDASVNEQNNETVVITILLDILKTPELRQQMTTEFTTYAPICFLYERNTPRSNEITTQLQARYFNSTDDWLTFDGLKDVNFLTSAY